MRPSTISWPMPKSEKGERYDGPQAYARRILVNLQVIEVVHNQHGALTRPPRATVRRASRPCPAAVHTPLGECFAIGQPRNSQDCNNSKPSKRVLRWLAGHARFIRQSYRAPSGFRHGLWRFWGQQREPCLSPDRVKRATSNRPTLPTLSWDGEIPMLLDTPNEFPCPVVGETAMLAEPKHLEDLGLSEPSR